MPESLGESRGSVEAIPRAMEGPLFAIGALVLTLLLLGPSLQSLGQGGAFAAILLGGANACLGLAASRKRGAALALCLSLGLAALLWALPPSSISLLIGLAPALIWFAEDKVWRVQRERRELLIRLDALRKGPRERWLECLSALAAVDFSLGLDALLANPSVSGPALDQLFLDLPGSLRCALSLARLKICEDPEQRHALIQSVLETIDGAPAPEDIARGLIEGCRSEEERGLLSPIVHETKSLAANLIFALSFAKSGGVSELDAANSAQRLAEIAVESLIACDREVELGHLLDSAKDLWGRCDAGARLERGLEVLREDPSPSLLLALGPQLRGENGDLLRRLSERDEPEILSALAVVLEEAELAGLREEIAGGVVARVREMHPEGENAIADEICREFGRAG